MVFRQQRLQKPMHSKVMTDKHMSSMTVFVSFVNISLICFLYFRCVCKVFFYFDFTTTIQYILFSFFMCHCTDFRFNNWSIQQFVRNKANCPSKVALSTCRCIIKKTLNNQIKHRLYAALLGPFALFLSIYCFGQVVHCSLISMAQKRSKNKKQYLENQNLALLHTNRKYMKLIWLLFMKLAKPVTWGMCVYLS